MPVCGKDTSLPSVPRSKGCLTCVARKSRCDGRRPTCQACEGRKQVCRGYRRDNFVFLNDGWRAPGVSKAGRNKPSKPRDKSPAYANRGQINDSGNRAQEEPGPCIMAASPPLYRRPSIDRIQLSAAFFMTGFATKFITTPHFMASLFRIYFSVDSYATINAGASASLRTPAVLAVNALAQGHFGRAMGDAESVEQSFHKYGLALKSMTSSISALGFSSLTLDGVCEENWQHFAFFCVVMTFWELKMCPLSTNWQSHIRALSDAIALRGEDHPYSKTNKQLIAASRLMISLQTLSSRQLGSLTPYEWRKRSTIRSAWLTEAKTTIYTSEDLIPSWGTEIYTFLDSLMDSLPTLASLISRYDKLVVQLLQTGRANDSEPSQALLELYHEAETLLSQTQLSATVWQKKVYEVPITDCQSNPNADQEEAKGHSKFWHTFEQDLHSLFDTVLHFHSMHEYQAFTLYWTVVISLHLQLADMLSVMMAINSQFIPADPGKEIRHHRAQLVGYAENVLRAIAFAENVANRRLAPFFITTAFQMTTVVLEKECEALRGEHGNLEIVRRYEAMKALAWRYMKWGLQTKIPIKLDTTGRLS
ncbi:unnamed protein product [Clonostachys rhizophaga]|uniref:Zn(2)-C6 fungal-type domain-containing protein n=1 Tax=Clonostachys rhizophaga TaxID=160324 RepID=A0A9N9YGN1_9HYPO|nr:unnamed protein product [Clonostachys rhizophaga]